jgi:GINS complex subunit 4
MLSAIS